MGEPAYDVAVLGGGAAGLMASIHAAERGLSVLLLEKNRRPGVKILISGGTRCNITNARGLRNTRVVSGPIDPSFDPALCKGSRAIIEAFGENGGFLAPALKSFNVEQTIEFFESENVAAKIEANGKIFPVTDRAADVLDALSRRLQRSGAHLRCGSPVLGVEASGDGFEITTPAGAFACRNVIVAMGGQSFPGCGTTGDGFAIARGFGHTIVEPRPALVPLRVRAEWVAALKGVTVPDVSVSVIDGEGAVRIERRESLLFAHFGLSGPAILDVSGLIARSGPSEARSLRVDWIPTWRADALDQHIQPESRVGRRGVSNLIPESLPKRLAEALVLAAGIPAHRVGPELSRDERRRLVAALKGLVLPVADTLGFAKAEVTSGGVALAEVDSRTMESNRRAGLFFVGEVLDLDGLIGGYNFQAAWSTGWLAGGVV